MTCESPTLKIRTTNSEGGDLDHPVEGLLGAKFGSIGKVIVKRANPLACARMLWMAGSLWFLQVQGLISVHLVSSPAFGGYR